MGEVGSIIINPTIQRNKVISSALLKHISRDIEILSQNNIKESEYKVAVSDEIFFLTINVEMQNHLPLLAKITC